MKAHRFRFAGFLAIVAVFGTTAWTGAVQPGSVQASERTQSGSTPTEPVVFDAEMSGDEVAPDPVDTGATGTATAVLQDNTLTIGGGFQGLSSPLRDIADLGGDWETDGDVLDPGVHVHEGEPGTTTGYIFALAAHLDHRDDTSADFSGSWVLTESQIETLLDEGMYLDVHTGEHPGGEIRGQLLPRKDATGVELFEAELEGENVVPRPVRSPAHGRASAFLEGEMLTVGGEFSGLRSELRDRNKSHLDPGIHIHPGAADETGPYIYELIAGIDGDEGSGTFFGHHRLTAEETELLRSERLYIDIHTAEHEDGEVRGQLRPVGREDTEGSGGPHGAQVRWIAESPDPLTAEMTDRGGEPIGTVSFSRTGEATLVEVSLADLAMDSGFRGFHLHEHPKCEPGHPDGPFASAGGHWDPDGRDHGGHRGDLPPLLVLGDGSAQASFVTDRFTVDELREAGVAVILHEEPDNLAHIPDRYRSEDAARPGPDEETLATGDAGDRFACGTIT